MAMVRQSLHRRWIALVTVAGSMWATSNAVMCETKESIRSAIASGIVAVCPRALVGDAPVLDRSRLAAVDRLTASVTAQTSARPCAGPCVCRSRPLVTPDFVTGLPIEGIAPVAVATNVSNVPDSLPHVVRTARPSTLHWHKRHRAVPTITPLSDPNDDGTSDDTDDDDDTSKSVVNNDNTNVPIIAGLQEKAPYLIHLCRTPGAWTAPSSSPFLAPLRLRC